MTKEKQRSTLRDKFLSEMKRIKKRVTPARLSMFKILNSAHSPITAETFVKKIGVNKTTAYRDINLFLKNGFIEEADFGDGIIRYEIKERKHHHHLVCLRCKKVQDISFNENLEWEEKQIRKYQGFQVIRHDLEFFGYCHKCTPS